MTLPTRWLVRGTLTTEGPLHLGSGAVTHREGLVNEETGAPVEVAAVAVDHRGRPYLPATALKGALRRRLTALGIPRERLDPLLGHPVTEEEEERQRGGEAEVWDAPVEGEEAPAPEPEPPFWSRERLTGVAARVSIDRRTGAAAHQRLFHLEWVPAGVGFQVTVAGALDQEEVALLVAGLQGFNDSGAPGERLTLGAETVQGWGRLRWEPGEIRRLDPEGVGRWLEAGAPGTGTEALEPVPDEEREALLRKARAAAAETSPGPSSGAVVLSLEIALTFDGPFLVNDPSRTGPGEDVPDHAPLRDADGRAYLPASSFRGLLRSQAERILRTVRGPDAACGPGARRRPCEPPRSVEELTRLCPVCRIFGAAGWRSPVSLSDFRSGEETAGEPWRQELLAIDRFTGGGASEWQGLETGYSGLKFNAEGSYRPLLRGRLEIDLAALDRACCSSWALALLALTLRDLVEGDLAFGWGSGKGYGRCTARIEDVALPAWDAVPETLRRELEQVKVTEAEVREDARDHLLDPNTDLGFALMSAIVDLAKIPIDRDGKERR